MSVRVMSQVWGLDLPDSEMLIMLALADWSNDEGVCWPSIAQLRAKTRKGERTIQGVIKSLVSKGHMSRTENCGQGCVYTLHPRSDCAPAAAAPRKVRTPAKSAPPQRTTPTPAAAADNTSIHTNTPMTSNEVIAPVPVSTSVDDDRPLTADEVLEAWNIRADELGLPKAKMTDARRKALRSRLRTHTTDDFTEAISALGRSAFLRGENERGWRADFDFFLQPKSFQKLIEGGYDRAAH